MCVCVEGGGGSPGTITQPGHVLDDCARQQTNNPTTVDDVTNLLRSSSLRIAPRMDGSLQGFLDGGADNGRILDCFSVVRAKSVTCTNCGDDGAIKISDWLRTNAAECKLTRLCLSRVRGDAMSCKGATSVAQMLAHNTTLTQLELGNNR